MYASSSGHWYDKEGNPAYMVENKSKGGMRQTRITDARKIGLVPSVTTILKVLDKPALMNWKVERILEAASMHGFEPAKEDYKSWSSMVKDKAFGADVTGVDVGTEIHGAIEAYYSGQDTALMEKYRPWVDAVADEINIHLGDHAWCAEKSFSSRLGYGGKVDLHSSNVVIDFKTKDFSKGTPKAYDEQVMQLVAYETGLDLQDADLLNVFIDRNDPIVHIVEHTDMEERGRLWQMFSACLDLWCLKNKYRPTF